MGAIFFANGPAFVNGIQIDSLENVDVYPLVSKILDLKFDSNKIDGSLHSTKPILK